MIIAQITDLHVRPEGRAAYRVAETNMLTERALRAAAALRPTPDLIVLSGDLAFDGQATEYAVLKDILARQIRDIPVYLIAGNHDRRETLREAFADLPGVAADPEFIQYTVEHLPARLVMLDTIVPGEPHGELCARRLAWLDRTLADAPERPTLIVMHHPPFVTGIGHMDTINLRNSDEFAAVLDKHRQVSRIICGHHHRTIFAPFAQTICSIAPSVAHQVELDLAGGAHGMFVMEPSAYHVHLWSEATGFVTHTAFVEAFPGPYPFKPEPD